MSSESSIIPQLEKLRCMLTQSPLKLADPNLIRHVNAAISRGELRDNLGRPVDQKVSQALTNDDRTALYPVVDGVVQLVREELIPLRTSDLQ